MKELANNILAQIEVDISGIDLYGYNIIEASLPKAQKPQKILADLRTKYTSSLYKNRMNPSLSEAKGVFKADTRE